MSDDVAGSRQKEKLVRSFTDHVRRMPTWHKQLLALAIVMAIVGVSAQAVGYFSRAEQKSGKSEVGMPPGARSVVSDDASAREASATRTWSDTFATWATRIGVSFVIGFIIGWIFRAFLKTMLLLTMLGAGALIALSYFNVINIDFSAARTKYESGMGWVSDQASKLKDSAMAHLPSSVPAIFGGFLGMRRK